jgi:hypothetical protein
MRILHRDGNGEPGYPVSVTFDQGKVDDNHSLDNLWATLQRSKEFFLQKLTKEKKVAED